jgi:hypothetical protein
LVANSRRLTRGKIPVNALPQNKAALSRSREVIALLQVTITQTAPAALSIAFGFNADGLVGPTRCLTIAACRSPLVQALLNVAQKGG